MQTCVGCAVSNENDLLACVKCGVWLQTPSNMPVKSLWYAMFKEFAGEWQLMTPLFPSLQLLLDWVGSARTAPQSSGSERDRRFAGTVRIQSFENRHMSIVYWHEFLQRDHGWVRGAPLRVPSQAQDRKWFAYREPPLPLTHTQFLASGSTAVVVQRHNDGSIRPVSELLRDEAALEDFLADYAIHRQQVLYLVILASTDQSGDTQTITTYRLLWLADASTAGGCWVPGFETKELKKVLYLPE